MTDLQLSRFPLEILEIIINFVPRSELYRLNGIEYLETLVLHSLYSSVRITSRVPYYYGMSETPVSHTVRHVLATGAIPEFSCFKELIDFLEENRLPFPKYVNFLHPIDIILAYESDPSILEDCIIETDLKSPFSSDAYSLELREFYLQRLISLPLKIRYVKNCGIIHEIIPESSFQFTRKLKTASFNNEFPLESFFGDNRYQNLINLYLSFKISHEAVTLIPRSVKKLNCEVVYPGFQVEELGFPRGLRSLSLTLCNFPEQYCLNFSNLERLVKLEFDGMRDNELTTFYNFSFPKSLKQVKSFALAMEVIKNQCPGLTSLECKRVRHAENKDNFFNFPDKLTDLRVNLDVLRYIEQCENDPFLIQVDDSETENIIHSTSINLPKDLQSLHVTDDSWIDGHEIEFSESQTLFSNKEENILHNLTSMKLTDVTSYIRFGPIPRSLTHLEFISSDHRMKSLDDDFFENLKNLTNLKFLTIECPLDSCFDYELPPKLQCFQFENPNLREISIESESLKCLRIRNARFKVITSENFQIPERLVELVMIGCDIRSFDESFTLPKNLQILDLKGNSLDPIPKLPPKLKSFSCSYGAAKPDQIEFSELPTTLEEFAWLHYAYSEECSFTPNLSHLINLKKLSLSSQIFSSRSTISFNLDNLPKSLTTISLPYCGIEKFTGTFTDFPKLEHLNLSINSLGSWLSSSLNEFQFGAAIRTIELKDNQLDLDTARKLLFSLKQKPDFRTLIVENMPIPEDLQNLVLERYLTPYKQR